MNKVFLIGRLTRDPEMRTISTGAVTTTFSIAVNRNFTNSQGERTADFFNCIAWRKLAENISKYCQKGTQIAIEGRIQNRSYNAQDGTKRYVTEIICDNVTFLSSRNDSSSYVPNDYEQPNVENEVSDYGKSPDIASNDLAEDPYANMGAEVSLSDDDLPF